MSAAHGYTVADPRDTEADTAVEATNVFEIPCRSPDLNPLDYAIWAEVNRRMRDQEQNWKNKKESREQYLARLKSTAQGLERDYVDGVIGNMAARCERLYRAKGGFFLEGGSSE